MPSAVVLAAWGPAVLVVEAQAPGRRHMAERTGIRVEHETVRLHLRAEGGIVPSTDPEYAPKKTIEETRDGPKPGDHFYYADGFDPSWMPTLSRPCGARKVGG